jgi:hypothetical protein
VCVCVCVSVCEWCTGVHACSPFKSYVDFFAKLTHQLSYRGCTVEAIVS